MDFPKKIMEQSEFLKLVEEALQDLPEKIHRMMDNVAICVEEAPSQEQLRKVGARRGGFLLGLYEGVPKTKWGRGFGMILPDKITIFQASIENFASNTGEVKKIIRNTVFHEIAHHFGFDEKGVRELERKRRKKL